jgi:hypothetical protein
MPSDRATRRAARKGIVGIDVPVPAKGDVKTERPAPEPKAKPLAKTPAPKPAKSAGDVKVSDG